VDRGKIKIDYIAPMLFPDGVFKEKQKFNQTLNLYTPVFDVIPGVQGIGETFSFVINDQFYKPGYGHFCAKLVKTDTLERSTSTFNFRKFEKKEPEYFPVETNGPNLDLFKFDDFRSSNQIKVSDEESHSCHLSCECYLKFSSHDLVLKKSEIGTQGLIIKPVERGAPQEDTLYKISPFMTSYSLLIVASNVIQMIKANFRNPPKYWKLLQDIFLKTLPSRDPENFKCYSSKILQSLVLNDNILISASAHYILNVLFMTSEELKPKNIDIDRGLLKFSKNFFVRSECELKGKKISQFFAKFSKAELLLTNFLLFHLRSVGSQVGGRDKEAFLERSRIVKF
jgi:hypothetical protein